MVSLVITAMVNKQEKKMFFFIKFLLFLAINFPALNNLLQMFTTNMNLNANKLPILVPSNSSSNITLSSQHGSNQSLNIPEQQHTLHSPRSQLSSNSNPTSYNNESSLLICGPNTNNPQNTHLNSNSSLTSTIATHSNGPYPPRMAPLYANSASSLPNASAGKLYSIVI